MYNMVRPCANIPHVVILHVVIRNIENEQRPGIHVSWRETNKNDRENSRKYLAASTFPSSKHTANASLARRVYLSI